MRLLKYKFNDYLLVNQDDNQDIIFYDTLRYHSVLVKKEDYDIFNDFRNQILSTGDYNGPKENIEAFLEHNIIRNANEDVEQELQKRYDEVMNAHRMLSLIILPTEKCNFRCIYCYEDYKLGKMNSVTMDRIIELIEELIPNYDILNISWFGGEPLLAMDVIREISGRAELICKKYRKAYYSQMTTNGYLLDIDTIKELLKLHIVMYQVTIDGDHESHNKQRPLADGSNTYDVIINNLLAIKNQIKTKTIKIIIRVNVSENMDANEIISLSNMFADDNRFVLDIQKIFGTYSTEKKEDTYYQSYLNVYDQCHEHIVEDLTADITMCYAARKNTLMIRSDGTLGKCTVNFNDPNNIFGNMNTIDLSTFSLESIEYCNCVQTKKECIECCIYPLCFGRQCPAKHYQLCKNMIGKYQLLIKTYSRGASVMKLI